MKGIKWYLIWINTSEGSPSSIVMFCHTSARFTHSLTGLGYLKSRSIFFINIWCCLFMKIDICLRKLIYLFQLIWSIPLMIKLLLSALSIDTSTKTAVYWISLLKLQPCLGRGWQWYVFDFQSILYTTATANQQHQKH